MRGLAGVNRLRDAISHVRREDPPHLPMMLDQVPRNASNAHHQLPEAPPPPKLPPPPEKPPLSLELLPLLQPPEEEPPPTQPPERPRLGSPELLTASANIAITKPTR